MGIRVFLISRRFDTRPSDQAVFTSFYEDLTRNRGFAKKCCLLCRSRGGLLVGNWAISHPEKVAGIAGIYPVFDLASYPGIKKAAESFGLNKHKMKMLVEQHNLVSRMNVLAEANVKMFLIHGDADESVPLSKNSLAVEQKYERANTRNSITLVVAKGHSHDCWNGYFQNNRLVDFVIKHSHSKREVHVDDGTKGEKLKK